MATKTCINPTCRKPNRPERNHCEFCGTRLPSVIDPPAAEAATGAVEQKPPAAAVAAKPDSQVMAVALGGAHGQAEVSDADKVDELAKLHVDRPLQAVAPTSSSTGNGVGNQPTMAEFQQILAENQQLKSARAVLQIVHEKVVEEKQNIAAALEHLKLTNVTSAPGGTAAPLPDPKAPSLLSRITRWGLPVVAFVGGLFGGTHTPLNTSRSQNGQMRQQLQSTATEVTAVDAQRDAAVKKADAAEQKSGELAQQVATMQAQQVQSTQTGAAQLNAAQHEIATLKASVSKSAADMAQLQRKNELTEQRYAQVVAENTRRGEQLASMQSMISKHPLLSYNGQTTGSLTIGYTSKNGKPATITVDHQHVSGNGVDIDTVTGNMLPGVPVVVQALDNSSVVEQPSAGNGWARFTLAVTGKGKHQASLHWSVPQ